MVIEKVKYLFQYIHIRYCKGPNGALFVLALKPYQKNVVDIRDICGAYKSLIEHRSWLHGRRRVTVKRNTIIHS